MFFWFFYWNMHSAFVWHSEKLLKVAKLFIPLLSHWRCSFYPRGSQIMSKFKQNVWNMCIFSICYVLSWQHCFIQKNPGQELDHQLRSSCLNQTFIDYCVFCTNSASAEYFCSIWTLFSFCFWCAYSWVCTCFWTIPLYNLLHSWWFLTCSGTAFPKPVGTRIKIKPFLPMCTVAWCQGCETHFIKWAD